MTAVCPNSPEHKRFVTVIHQAQDAVVDERGNFLENPANLDAQITHGPNPDNTWTCLTCGAQAKVFQAQHVELHEARP